MAISIKDIEKKVFSGERITEEEALYLFRSDDLLTIGELAHYSARKKNGDYVYFVVNRHINPSNICVNRCRFCAFSKDKGDHGAYTLTIDEIIERTRQAKDLGATEIHIVGGLHPDLPYEFYVEMLREIKREFPSVHLQAFTAVEIDYFSRISGKSVEDVLLELKDAGLGSLPGGGAEIFEERIRKRICPEKITGERWLEIMRKAHTLGIRSNATMLYGHLEDYESRVHHLSLLRKIHGLMVQTIQQPLMI
ncbi:MAG: CofH family radical SAM protein [Candidatus Aenigmatarchaeota archaeon]